MSTLTIGTVLDELVEGLGGLGGLSLIGVYSAAMGPDYAQDHIELGYEPITWEEELMGLGENERIETYSIPGRLLVTGAGNDEPSVKQVRDDALERLGYIETYLMDYPDLSDVCLSADMRSGEISQGIYEGEINGRYVEVKFVLDIRATKTP